MPHAQISVRPEFLPNTQRLARSLFLNGQAIPARTRAFLQDFSTPENRYPLRSVQHLIIASRCATRPEDRLMLAEIIRGECLVDAPMCDVATIADRELQAQYEADIALREWERRRCQTSREILIAKHAVHLNAVRELIDAHHRQ